MASFNPASCEISWNKKKQMPWEDEAEGGLIKIFNEAVSGDCS